MPRPIQVGHIYVSRNGTVWACRDIGEVVVIKPAPNETIDGPVYNIGETGMIWLVYDQPGDNTADCKGLALVREIRP